MKKNIFPLDKAKICKYMGSKAENLLFLKKNGFDIPLTYICLIDERTDAANLKEQLQKNS